MKNTNWKYTLNVLCRWIVGLVFIFSSFVKGVDPMGTSFKVQEYMTAWSVGSLTFEWALPLATPLAVALVSAEFLVGVLLLTNSFRRFSAWLLALMMLFFTCTTLIDAITNKVTDCGCFGDAVKLTNWQTFWKNIALDIPTVWIFLTRNLNRRRRFERDAIIFLFAAAAMVAFAIYNVKHEPVVDFRPWKVGAQMVNTDPSLSVQSFVSYQNNHTGEIVEVPSLDCAKYEDDTLSWTCVGTRVVDPHEIQAPGFSMLDLDGNDMAIDIISSPDSVLIATIHHLDEIDKRGISSIKSTASWASDEGVYLVILSSALPEDIQAFLYENDLSSLDFFFADATAIETMTRSNPGYVMLKDGKVLGKWHHRDVKKLCNYE